MKTVIRALLALAMLAPLPVVAATYDLVIDRTDVPIEGQMRRVFSINGEIAGPALRWKEGEDVTVNVTNRLKEETSIHWHGVLVPYVMDGVPMVSFAGIEPGATFTYRFKVRLQDQHIELEGNRIVEHDRSRRRTTVVDLRQPVEVTDDYDPVYDDGHQEVYEETQRQVCGS